MAAISASCAAGGRGSSSRCCSPAIRSSATWRARLDEHLGNYTVEATTQRAARLIEGPPASTASRRSPALLRLLPERDPHPQLYEGLAAIVDCLDDPLIAGGADRPLRAAAARRSRLRPRPRALRGDRHERRSRLCLAEDGAGGQPRRRRALSRPAAAAAARSCSSRRRRRSPPPADLADAFRLTGYFLARHVYEPRGLDAVRRRGPVCWR